jgi:hypothetical protein
MQTPALTELPRNDIAAARRYYESRGEVSPDALSILYQLQDDSTELRRVVQAEGWKVRERDLGGWAQYV